MFPSPPFCFLTKSESERCVSAGVNDPEGALCAGRPLSHAGVLYVSAAEATEFPCDFVLVILLVLPTFGWAHRVPLLFAVAADFS